MTLLLALLCACHGAFAKSIPLDVTERRSYISKTYFSAANRAVFVAGLEGTGHHSVDRMIVTINKAKGTNYVEVAPEKVQAVMYRGGTQPTGAFLLAQEEPLEKVADDRVSVNFRAIPHLMMLINNALE